MAFRGEEINTRIGPGSVFEGKLAVHGSLEINGRFEGELRVEDHVVVGETGRVKTNIVARKVTIGGTLFGNIEASEEVQILATGRVMGNITAPVINMLKGSVTKGEVTLTGGSNLDVDKIFQESWIEGEAFEASQQKSGKEAKKK